MRSIRRCAHHDTAAISTPPPASTNHCADPSSPRAALPRLTVATAVAALMAPRREPFDFVAQSGPFMSWFCSARIALFRRSQRSSKPTALYVPSHRAHRSDCRGAWRRGQGDHIFGASGLRRWSAGAESTHPRPSGTSGRSAPGGEASAQRWDDDANAATAGVTAPKVDSRSPGPLTALEGFLQSSQTDNQRGPPPSKAMVVSTPIATDGLLKSVTAGPAPKSTAKIRRGQLSGSVGTERLKLEAWGV